MRWRPNSWYQARGSFAPAGGYSYTNAEAATVVAGMSSTPNDTRKGAIDTLVGAWKTAGAWAALDAIWVIRAHDAQAGRVNWKNPGTFDLTAVNSPTFTTDRGYAGNGSTSYLDTGFIPNTHGVNYTLDSACMGAYIDAGTDSSSDSGAIMGAFGTAYARLTPWTNANGIGNRVNSGNSGMVAIGTTIATRYGLSVINRSASNVTAAYRNGASLGTANTVSANMPTTAVFIGCWNNNGTPTNLRDDRVGLAFIGGSMDATMQQAVDDAWDAYVTATT